MQCMRGVFWLAWMLPLAAGERRRVAVCGAGVAGSFLAHALDRSGLFQVSVFEVGRGPGGRSSTRRHESFSFDHGASCIRDVRSQEFRDILFHWESDRVIEVILLLIPRTNQSIISMISM